MRHLCHVTTLIRLLLPVGADQLRVALPAVGFLASAGSKRPAKVKQADSEKIVTWFLKRQPPPKGEKR